MHALAMQGFGKVLHELEVLGFDNDTIIVFWGDHGWQPGEHNMWGKFTNLEDATWVPFVLRVPGNTDAGMHSSAFVEHVDVFPTLVELTGFNDLPMCPENNMNLVTCAEDSSAVPLLNDPDLKWKKAAFSQFARLQYSGLTKILNYPFDSNNHGEDVMGYAIRVNNYRFVEWYHFNRTSGIPDFNYVWGMELYEHTEPTKSFNDENKNFNNRFT